MIIIKIIIKKTGHPVAFSSAFCVSKDICAFSEFPIPDHFPQFMLPSHALAYLQLYAEKFDLMKNIRLNTEIIKIKRATNWKENGKFNENIGKKEWI